MTHASLLHVISLGGYIVLLLHRHTNRCCSLVRSPGSIPYSGWCLAVQYMRTACIPFVPIAFYHLEDREILLTYATDSGNHVQGLPC